MRPMRALATVTGAVVLATATGLAPSGAATAPEAGATTALLIRSDPAAPGRSLALQRLGVVEEIDLGRGWVAVELSAPRGPANAAAQLARSIGPVLVEPDAQVTADLVPDDTNFGIQWGFQQASDVDIDAPEAWDVATGDGALVAVIDTGVQVAHPDLAPNVWVNPDEVPGNGIDDDANGFIDDINGWDFFNDDASVFDNAADDDHGTHVAGTVAAVTDNGVGVAGTAPDAQVMALKFIGPSTGSTSDAIQAINYAVAEGADVINNSWGGGTYVQALKDAIDGAGILSISAAGNATTDIDLTPHYPAAYTSTNVVSVASVNSDGALRATSNFGDASVDLGAPGGSIASTLPTDAYGYFSGTSMASPHVAGVAALLVGLGITDPADQRTALLDGAAPLASLSGVTVTGDLLNAYGSVVWACTTGGASCPGISPTIVDGTVTEVGSGAPLSGVSVRLLTTAGALVAIDSTDGAGAYAFADVAPGDYKLRFIDPSGSHRSEYHLDAATRGASTTLSIAGATTTTIDAALVISGGTVRGQVTQQGSGANLAGLSVRLLTTGNAIVATRTTAADGRYSFVDVPAGSYVVRFVDFDLSHVGEYHADAATFAAATPITVTMNGLTVVDAALASSSTGDLIGTVTEEGTGTPLTGISVRLLTLDGVMVATRTSQADGSFSVYGLVPASYVVRFIDLDGSHQTEYHVNAGNLVSAEQLHVTASGTVVVAGALLPA